MQKTLLYLVASNHLHTFIYYIYLVERGMPDTFIRVHRLGVAAHLVLCLLDGSLYLGFLCLALQVFQLDDVGVLHVRENFIS